MRQPGEKRLFSAVLAVLMLAACSQGRTQSPSATSGEPAAQAAAAVTPQKPPSYDVVSIRPNNQGPGSVRVSINMDVYAATNVSLVDLVRNAYDLRPGMLFNEPKWVDSSRFDIHAKILDTDPETLKALKPEDRRRMLREVLADRFHLQVHTEIKALPVYELVQAKGGAKLTDVAAEHRNDPFGNTSSGGLSIHNGSLTGHYLPMASFADQMSYQVNRPVLDKTGMAGHYNFQLTWTREDVPAADDAAAPPLFTALEEQLGLKLVPTKGPVTVLVIDRADLPSADEN